MVGQGGRGAGGGPGCSHSPSPPWWDVKNHLAAPLEGLGKGSPPGWLSLPSAGSGCACVPAEPVGTAVSPRATAGWVCSPAQGSDSTERHHFQLKHLDVFKTAFFKIIITNCRKAVA